MVDQYADHSGVFLRGVYLSWAEAAEYYRQGSQLLQQFQAVLYDLDRCEHGRHEGDKCFGCEEGTSHGNPLLREDRQIGFDIGGDPIRVPEPGKKHLPDEWRVPRA